MTGQDWIGYGREMSFWLYLIPKWSRPKKKVLVMVSRDLICKSTLVMRLCYGQVRCGRRGETLAAVFFLGYAPPNLVENLFANTILI